MILNALYISLTIYFVNFCFAPGGIFGFVGEYLECPNTNKILRFICKPLLTCTVCMSPYYTYVICKYYADFNGPTILLTVGVVGGINVIISTIIGFLNSYNGMEGRIDE